MKAYSLILKEESRAEISNAYYWYDKTLFQDMTTTPLLQYSINSFTPPHLYTKTA